MYFLVEEVSLWRLVKKIEVQGAYGEQAPVNFQFSDSVQHASLNSGCGPSLFHFVVTRLSLLFNQTHHG